MSLFLTCARCYKPDFDFFLQAYVKTAVIEPSDEFNQTIWPEPREWSSFPARAKREFPVEQWDRCIKTILRCHDRREDLMVECIGLGVVCFRLDAYDMV